MQFKLCTLGEVFAYDPDTADLLSDILSIAAGPPLDMCKTAAHRRVMLAVHDRGKAEVGARLTSLFTEAVRTGKLERVQRLAAATSMASRGAVSPQYMWLWVYLGLHSLQPKQLYNTFPPWRAGVTFAQVQREHERHFDPIEPPQLRQMVKALGWILAPGKPGPRVRNNSH